MQQRLVQLPTDKLSPRRGPRRLLTRRRRRRRRPKRRRAPAQARHVHTFTHSLHKLSERLAWPLHEPRAPLRPHRRASLTALQRSLPAPRTARRRTSTAGGGGLSAVSSSVRQVAGQSRRQAGPSTTWAMASVSIADGRHYSRVGPLLSSCLAELRT